MKVWITTSAAHGLVEFRIVKPTFWRDHYYDDSDCTVVCRNVVRRLLRGTDKRPPRHGTREIVEVELTAK